MREVARRVVEGNGLGRMKEAGGGGVGGLKEALGGMISRGEDGGWGWEGGSGNEGLEEIKPGSKVEWDVSRLFFPPGFSHWR